MRGRGGVVVPSVPGVQLEPAFAIRAARELRNMLGLLFFGFVFCYTPFNDKEEASSSNWLLLSQMGQNFHVLSWRCVTSLKTRFSQVSKIKKCSLFFPNFFFVYSFIFLTFQRSFDRDWQTTISVSGIAGQD